MKNKNNYLTKELINIHIKEKVKQAYTSKKYSTFFDGRVLQICFFSKGCRYSKNGSCIICDYGKVRKENLTKKDIIEILDNVFNNLTNLPDVLLLNSLGSVLDTSEMPLENIIVLLEQISKLNIKTVIFETHYLSINSFILELIHKKLNNKKIIIEMGLESSNKEIRELCLNKYIDNNDFIKRVNLIKSIGFEVETNIIFGMPFLSLESQVKDTLNSIKWCFNHNIDGVNLFPINIKPYTLLYRLYEDKKYSPIHHKDFIELLSQIPEEYLEKTYLCWYGNRKLEYDKGETILPICPAEKYNAIMNFYKEFNMNRSSKTRLNLLNNIKLEMN